MLTYLPNPRMPLAPLARQSKRSFSMESVVLYRARWALLIISVSCLVVALCGLFKNISEREIRIVTHDYDSGVWKETENLYSTSRFSDYSYKVIYNFQLYIYIVYYSRNLLLFHSQNPDIRLYINPCNFLS